MTSTIRPRRGAAQPSAARMMAIIERLASDDFTGRRTGTPGGHAAAAWLTGHLTSLGADVTCDEFAVTGAVKELQHPPALQWTDGTSTWQLQHRRDFAEHLASAYLPQPVTGPLRRFATGDPQRAWLLDTTITPDHAAHAAATGALGVITARGTDAAGWMPKMVNGPATIALPVLSVREDIHQQMTDAAPTGSAQLTASVPLKAVDTTGINVHGVFTTAAAGNISVLLTAHYDGVGDDADLRHPAACDNASGVAVILETARLLTTTVPGIGVAVALLDAEEAGLHGAAHHAPHVPTGTYVINLDGAATLDHPAAVEAGGPAHHLLLALDHAARKTGIPLQASAIRSDNRRYTAAGLPTIGIGMGMPGYQTPAETPNRVQPHTLTATATLILSTVDKLAATSRQAPRT